MHTEAETPHEDSPVRSFFQDWLPAHLQGMDTPPAPGVFVIDVLGECGGRWTVDLGGTPPGCRPGGTEGADATVTIEEADLAAVLRHETGLEELFYRQRVRVDGDLIRVGGLLPLFVDTTGPESSLATLLAPYAAEEFLARHWPGVPLVLPPAQSRLDAIESLLPVADVETLLDRWRAPVRVFPPSPYDQMSAHVTSEAAAQLHARGFTFLLNLVDRWFPDLRAWVEKMQTDLGLPRVVRGWCMIYVSPQGSGFKPHFDENANFVIQLRGAKRWRLAPNGSVVDPTVSHRLGGSVDSELLGETHAPLPDQMPEEGAFEVVLEPGALLFLPRSHWHCTTALEPSMSLNFTFDQPCWADVLSKAIRSRLVRQPQWRALAVGAGGSDGRAVHATLHAAELLADLAAELSQLDAEELLRDIPPRGSDEQALDLKRDWVAMLTQLVAANGRSDAEPSGPDAPASRFERRPRT